VIEGKDQSESRIGDRDKNLLQRERQYRIKHLRNNNMRTIKTTPTEQVKQQRHTDRTGKATETHTISYIDGTGKTTETQTISYTDRTGNTTETHRQNR
jgi:hypothetical protein